MNKTIKKTKKLVTIFEELFLICCSINITSLIQVSRAESTQSGGVREHRGVGNTKISDTIPRGVHAARQKHAPCVGLVRDRRTITTDMDKIYP